jgi:hypothetical protein
MLCHSLLLAGVFFRSRASVQSRERRIRVRCGEKRALKMRLDCSFEFYDPNLSVHFCTL